MGRDQNLSHDGIASVQRNEQGGTPQKIAKEMRSGTQIAVFGAMAVVVFTTAFASYSEGYLSGLMAVVLGLSGFVGLVSIHSLIRHYKNTLELGPRVDNVEVAVEGLKGDVSQIGDMSEKFRLLEELTQHVADIQLRLKEGPGEASYPGNGGESSGILQEVAGLEEEIRGIRDDFERANSNQSQRFSSELHLLQSLIKQVSEQVTAHEHSYPVTPPPMKDVPTDAVFEVEPEPEFTPSASEEFGAEDEPAELEVSVPVQYADEAPVPESDPFDEGDFSFQELEQTLTEYEFGHGETDIEDVVRDAIENNRVELFLQPIVGVRDRKVRCYEALTRLRDESGQLILPSNYLGAAERAGMMPLIDNVMLFRTVQVIQRLSERDSTRGIFCNISPVSLVDPEFFPEFIDFMGENRHLSEHLVFEFPQPMMRRAGVRELEGLAALAEYGFQFSLDMVTNLNVDFRALSDRGFRFLKLDVRVFLHGMADAGARIHAADMAGYLQRYGLELIVERVEDERSAASLIDYDVQLAQGYLYSEPRPVRPEVFGDGAVTEAA